MATGVGTGQWAPYNRYCVLTSPFLPTEFSISLGRGRVNLLPDPAARSNKKNNMIIKLINRLNYNCFCIKLQDVNKLIPNFNYYSPPIKICITFKFWGNITDYLLSRHEILQNFVHLQETRRFKLIKKKKMWHF